MYWEWFRKPIIIRKCTINILTTVLIIPGIWKIMIDKKIKVK